MRRLGIGLLAMAVGVTGCKKKPEEGAAQGGDAGGPQVAVPAARPVGMDDPFARLGNDGARQLNNGYRSLKAKKYDDARTAFEAVTQVTPDYTAARWQALRATALGGKFGDVPDAWAAILARDYVAYAGRLDKPKEMTALRAAPEWAAVKKAETQFRDAYAKGLDKGFFFVARTKEAAPLKWDDKQQATLDLKQEAYHYDPIAQKYRRVTETDGHVYAIAVSPDHKTLSFLVTRKLEKAADEKQSFVDPEVGYVNLVTLETVGPAAIKGKWPGVGMRFSKTNDPIFDTGDDKLGFDTAKTGLTKMEVAGGDSVTNATPTAVHQSPEHPAKVELSGDRRTLTIEGAEKPIKAARDIEYSTVDWSPAKKRITYAGTIDACKMVNEGAKDKNELFVWDQEKKAAWRVAAAVSFFDSVWLDDDKLVYEGGIGKDGKLHMVDLPTRNDVVLKPRYGAGLFGFPTLACEPPPSADDSAEHADDNMPLTPEEQDGE
jgi:hypothetical protein